MSSLSILQTFFPDESREQGSRNRNFLSTNEREARRGLHWRNDRDRISYILDREILKAGRAGAGTSLCAIGVRHRDTRYSHLRQNHVTAHEDYGRQAPTGRKMSLESNVPRSAWETKHFRESAPFMESNS